ncbi:PREDICTED: probable helicase senataxin [Leptosomus discolor]|uniref:probable helicase senataxin n=1 Tax=Leptosomus discolor TaxID=188344 RepID=UPI000522A70F|nr:PREDICTED: probable helicase senataxin [Leptosomus discolor]
MSTCRWCTPSGSDTTEFLKSYASKQLSPDDVEGSNDDLCYCLECVVEYHKAREKLPRLHEVLWELETSRLVAHIEKSMREEAGEDDELFIVNEDGETQLSGYVGPDFENNLRVPLLEILKYPYLLLHEKVSELCVEVLCRMEQSHNSFQVFEKYPGIYLFLVHPNEVIRRWAVLTARNLGKVDRDDYYDLQEVLTCLFKVVELGLFESPDIYSSSMIEKGKLILLPSHLYDAANYKNYWLGICMLLTVLEEQAMDSLLLGPDKQNDFMQSILHTMEKEAADDSTDPFWPALHCFMVILDQLGSKVWGQLIDPVQAFQTIINSASYNNEIKNIRSSFKRTKSEPESDHSDDIVTCSQIVYNYNTEKPQKDTGWKTAICPDYCPNMYEEMQTLANVLQSDIGRDIRVHDSTFLWFIPFVQSLMDLKDLGVAYIVEVIHYLCSEIKEILNERIQQCDKISEFFLLILVSIIELHRNKKCLHLLWISSQEWVEAVVRCTKLPAIAFTRCTEKASGHCVRGSSAVSLQASNSVQHACVQLIRSLLREGYQIGQHALCKQYLDKLNLLLRGNLSLGWQLNIQETQELQMCLKQVIRSIKDRALNTSVSKNEDDSILLSGISDTSVKKVSTEEKSSSLLQSALKKDTDMQTSDREQPDLNDLVKYDQYFKRENNSVRKKEEDFAKVASEDNTLTDSQVDRELSRLSLAAYAKSVNFPFDSSQESSVHHNVCDIKRKVKGAEDCGSQYFEFETEGDVFSVWEDTQAYIMEATQEYKQDRVSASASMPAVVPPRKVRQCPAPTSIVEKLGLKKAPRKAFELSQRSSESLAQLRSHGKAAGRVGVPLKRKTKEIAPQSLFIKHNKKFLACQDRQYLRQSRPKKSENSEDDDDDDLFLTQLDPVDMELCSQEESVQDTTIASKKPEDMDTAENLQQNESFPIDKCKYKDCTEKVEKPGECCSKHSATSSEADHLFAKPLLPPSKTRKPSTTKIFSSTSSSRNAAFSKDLEDVKKPPPASKSKVNAAKLVRDHSIFVNEVLKWTYEMFASSQFGPPSNLLQSVVASVPVQFQGYNDYFNTFFPLMMLNAFETLAQDWIEHQRVKEKSYYFYLQNFCADLNTADFTAHFQESDLARQLHPKEDDLIFLVVQKKKDTFREESEMENHMVNHVGLVTRFSSASGCLTRQKEQHTVCHLSVQTRGNLSFFINKQVKCVVVGSLVTVHRTFKGLLLLSRSPLAKPIINPSYNDFCPRDLPMASERCAASYMNEYNEDQKRAIETAYAMVKQHPGLPKICLIHGPPGTGKSKTIVGLLCRVLRENTRNEKTRRPNSKIKPNRFLVCAPSNAAVDELMKKIIVAFKEKCQNRQEPLGNCGDIKLVRLGAEKAINSEVRGFSLDKQVEHRMKRKPADCDQDIQKRKAALDQKLDMLSRERARHRCGKRESQMLDDEIGKLSKERQQLASRVKEVRGHSQKVQADIILESDIICCTLSTSGGGLLESTFLRQGLDPFSCVIVDEAGQSCEVETLIPLIHRCNKLVLVGDPRQLPPTVKSVKAQEYGYDQSLMARLHRHLEEQVQKNVLRSLPVVQLTVQYRMHPDICHFPSNYIYGRTLKTDRATEESRCSSEWPFQPYLIFDVADGCEERDNDSFSNPQEVKLVMEVIRTIKEKKKDLGFRRLGIITPYSAQKKKIQEQMDRVFRNNSPGEVDTVDAFQGREKDCIIVTCVRANNTKGSIGFLASLQRLNVTITRARFSLFILGRLETLMENGDWNELIQDAHKRGAIIKTSEENYKRDAVKILKLRPTWQHKLQIKAYEVCLVPEAKSRSSRAQSWAWRQPSPFCRGRRRLAGAPVNPDHPLSAVSTLLKLLGLSLGVEYLGFTVAVFRVIAPHYCNVRPNQMCVTVVPEQSAGLPNGAFTGGEA